MNDYLANQFRSALYGPSWVEIVGGLIGFAIKWALIGALLHFGWKAVA